jgi:uncharacterized membrane protein
VSAPPRGTMDPRVQVAVGNLLRTGVLLAVAVVLLGGVLYLLRHGLAVPSYHVFHVEPRVLRHPAGLVRDALAGRGRSIVQLGLILLVATPVARVAMTAVAFALERDRIYVVVALFVLALLLLSLIG